MRKDKTRRNLRNKILTISMSIVLFACVVITIIAVTCDFSTSETAFNPTTETYSSNQAEIINPNTSDSTTEISMTDAAASYSSIGNKTITISTDIELYTFSVKCKDDKNYLSKNYKLLSNIYYKTNQEFIPIGYGDDSFSGTFDGNGYEITNFKMVSITEQIGNQSTYANMQYYAMFSKNSGTIQNLGIVEPRNSMLTVEIDNIITGGGVANFVGHNEVGGVVQYCYIKDLRDAIDEEIGIGAYGGYRIASFLYLNDGTFENCYAAINAAANHKVNSYESLCSLCYQDNNYNASNSNLYYFDGSISTYSSVGGAVEITYVDEMFSDATFLDPKQNVGVYCSSTDILNSKFESDNKWYLPSKYNSTIASYIKNDTAILRGLSYTITDGITTFAINDVKNFLYMFELMNGSDFFAGDKVIYQINADINLLNINPDTYVYKKIITSTITSNKTGGTIKPTLATNTVSSYPSIYNFNCIAEDRKATTLGIDAYGLFPYLGGTISYLNIIPKKLSLDDVEVRNNVKGIGAVSGYVEKGHITNVNVYIETEHTSTDIKEFYLGGLVGILGGEGTIDNCTAAGSFTMDRFVSTAPIASVYTQGDAIGGVVGYICDTYGTVKTCLSAVDMTLNMNSTAVNYQIGGVIGAAYTIEAEELENTGTITVGTSSSAAGYNNIYLSGVIGRHLGVKNQVKNFTNQGNISLYGSNASAKTYISGIENADILTTSVSQGLIASTQKTKDGKYYFSASSLTNRANVLLGNAAIADVANYTSGINVLTENGFVTDLSGVYNLNYTEKYVSGTKTKATLGAQSFNIVMAHKYSGVVNVINGATPNENYTTNLKTVYNLRDFTLTASQAIAGSYTYEYYGTARGKYINYDDVRNEGSITTTIDKNIGTKGTDTVNIYLIGVLEEVSEGCFADKIYNGKDISLTFTGASISGNVVASGICLRNKGYDADTIDHFNPSSNDFDSKAKGALNDVINNGNITVDNPTNFATITYSYPIIASANGQSYLGSFPFSTYSNGNNITGDVFTSGIVAYNEAPITNTFNLGNIFAANYISDQATEREINVAGIVNLNIGKYAYILNSANNGTLKGINLSTGIVDHSEHDGNGTKFDGYDNCTPYLSNVNVAGIIARNDELENGSDYVANNTNQNSKQIVSFTINYGDIYSYNLKSNIQSTSDEPAAKSAGIVAMGLLNTINVLNYGNIYSSETASGIFGVMYFTKFASEVTSSNKVSIANTINYGNVYMLSKGYNNSDGNTVLDYKVIEYSRFKNMTTSTIVKTSSTLGNNEAFTSIVRGVAYMSVNGSIFSLANFATSSNSQNIAIRYLISFNEACPIVGATVSAPTGITVSTDTLFSAHISTHAASGAYLNDNWINSYVQYAPLSTSTFGGKFVTSIDTSGVATTATKSYYGIFNSNFEFQKAILGKTTINLTANPTDAYLTDYFEFVGFKYINSVLFEKIGWQTLAYSAAANDFAMNVANVVKVLDKSNGYITSTVTANAKNAFNWMNDSVADDLDVLIDSMIAKDSNDDDVMNHTDLINMLNYIFSDDSQSNIFITKTVRQNILNKLVSSDSELLSLLNTMLQYENGYSATIAKSIIVEEDEVKALIDRYIDEMTDRDALLAIYDSYLTYLEANTNAYFTYANSESKRIDALTTLFANLNDNTFYTELVSILGISDSTLSASAKMLAGYQSLNAANKKTLFETIVSQNLNNMDTYLGAMASEIDYFTELNANGYNVTSLEDIISRASLESGSTETSTNVVNERIALWNLIKDTSVFRTNFTNAQYGIPATTYFKATEYNNTYQSITEPHNGGAYRGETEEKLSYMYTMDITPQVYFYGPYTATNNTHTSSTFKFVADDGTQTINSPTVYTDTKSLNGHPNNYYSLFHYKDNTLWSNNTYGNTVMKSRGGSNSTTTFRQALTVTQNTNYTTYPWPMLIYYDSNNEQLGGANDTFNLSSNYYSGSYTTGSYPFRGFTTGNNMQFQSKKFTDPMTGITSNGTDWSGTLFGTNDWYMEVSSTGETFSLSNATMGTRFSNNGNKTVTLANGTTTTIRPYRTYIQDKDGAYHPVQASSTQTIKIGKMVNENFVATHTLRNFDSYSREIYSFIAYEIGLRMYTSTVGTNMHSTKRTGIYRRSGGWNNYFTWKQTENVHVYTSQYIDYKLSDLLNLDGYLTEYSDGTTSSADEREIINFVFNNYFLTSSNYQKFRRLVEASLLEALGDNSTRGESYIDTFFMNNIYASSKTALNNKIPFAYLNAVNNTTVQSYLTGLQSISSNNKPLLIYGAASNQEKYIALLKRLKAMRAAGTNANYSNYSTLLTYLKTHSGYVVNDKVVLSNFSTMSLTDLENYLACFDDDSDVTISSLYDMSGKMSAYSGSVTKNSATYGNTLYDYGLKFTSMTLTPASTDTRVILVAKSTGSSSTLTRGTTNVTVTGINEYYFETNGATSFTITSNSDVVVYEIKFVRDATNSNMTTTLTGSFVNDTITYDSNDNPLHESYFTITKNEIETHINNTIVSAIGSGTYYKVTGYSVRANVSVTSTAAQINMSFAGSKNNATLYPNSEFTCYSNTVSTAYLDMEDSYYGATIYAVQGNPGSRSFWRYISDASFTITYSFISEKEYSNSATNANSSTYTPNSYAMTAPTEADVRNVILNNAGSSTWNSETTINSVTMTVNIRNASNSSQYLSLYDTTVSSGSVDGYENTSGNGLYTKTLDLTQCYGHTFRVLYYNNNGFAYATNSNGYVESYSYVVNYTLNGYMYGVTVTNAITNETIYKNRLLNLDITYSDAQNKYLGNIYNSSTYVATLYNNFVDFNLTNFVMVNTSGNDNNPTNPFIGSLTTAKKTEFARTLAENSNGALYQVINALCSTNAQLGEVLKVMDRATNGYAFIADAVKYLDNQSTDLIDAYDSVKKSLVATYLVADYRSTYSQGGNLYNTKYSSLVTNVNNNAPSAYKNSINYINSDGTFTSTKYDKFVEYILGSEISTAGYGIFALASSRGIQNGAFIPDNLDLTSMDAKYDTTKKINNVSYIELTDTKDSSWRDGNGNSTASTYNTDVATSVNYHVRVEMKQLVKAISNVIFELDLECNDTILYSSTDQIDYQDKIITYYVSGDYLEFIDGASTLKIDYLLFADTATANKAKGDTISLSKKSYGYSEVNIDSSSFVANKYYTQTAGIYTKAATYTEGIKYYEVSRIDIAEAITITPEEHAYTAVYKLRFIKIDNTITTYAYYQMKYLATEAATSYTTTTNDRNIPYYGAIVTFKVTASLPDGMDLRSFFSITNQQKNVTWEFDPDTANNGIVNEGVAYIAVVIDISMNQGSKAFVLNLYGESKTVNVTKDANENSLITSFGYDGQDYTSDMQSSQSASSTILYGRAFNYDDLTKPYIKTTDVAINSDKTYYVQNGSNNYYSYTKVSDPVVEDIATYYEANPDFYLYAFEISSNATVAISATKSETDGLMTYDVTYSVKSESGTTTSYTHSLTEHAYFDDGQAYATLYKEGDNVDASGIYTTDFYYGIIDTEHYYEILASQYSDLTYDEGKENFVAVIFNRGYEPQYRIKYNFANFYGDISKYSVTQGEYNPATTSPQDTYAGITITIDDEHEPGTYKYNYVYTNTGEWTSEGSYVNPTEYDPNATYYRIVGGNYTVYTGVTADNFERLKARIYIYQTGDSTYTRTYQFPAFYIVKDFAVDALFHKLTFLDESVLLGGTASVMLPTTPISAGPNNTDNEPTGDAVIYNSVFLNAANQKIIINPNNIDYDDSAIVPSVTDYYTVGSVSDTDLENYAPTIKVEKHAQVFKYTTQLKLTKYGLDNKQATANGGNPYKDSDILSDHSDMYLYVPFMTGTGENASYEVFLVRLDSSMNWKKVYNPKDYNGNDESKLIKTYTGTAFNTAAAEEDPTLTTLTYDGKTYVIAPFAGSTDVTSDTSKNLSLYMDYIGDPLEDHFWYISYVVFSEYYMEKGLTDKNGDGKDDLGAVRYYHISIVDASNTVYFDVSLYAPVNFKLDEIYLTFAERVYDKTSGVYLKSVQMSCYVEKQLDANNDPIIGANNTPEAGLALYKLRWSMAALPAGYFYFYIDLPNGYGAICYTNKENTSNENAAPGSDNKGSYLPRTTIIPITIGLKIIVSELTGESSTVWAVNTSDLYTRKITYLGLETKENE